MGLAASGRRLTVDATGQHLYGKKRNRLALSHFRFPLKLSSKRWLVKRTFGWLNPYRRLSKDYELYIDHSEGMIYGALIRLILRRLAA